MQPPITVNTVRSSCPTSAVEALWDACASATETCFATHKATFQLSHLKLIASISPEGPSPAHVSHCTKAEPDLVKHSSAEGHVVKNSPVVAMPAKSRKSVIPGKHTGDPGNLSHSSSTKKTDQNRTLPDEAGGVQCYMDCMKEDAQKLQGNFLHNLLVNWEVMAGGNTPHGRLQKSTNTGTCC